MDPLPPQSEVQLSQEINTAPGRKNEREYECNHCNKILSSKQNLREHKFTHTGELPYICKSPGCGIRFRQGSVLSAHKRIHNMIEKCSDEHKFRWIKVNYI